MERHYYKKDMITPLRGFQRVVQEGFNMAKAATSLGVTSTAITHQIKALENTIGYQVFDRSKKILSFTEEGRLLYQKICPLLEQFHSVFDVVKNEINATKSNQIRIAVHHIAVSYILPRWIEKHNATYPDTTKIHIYDDIAWDEASQLLQNDVIDLMFFPTYNFPPEFFYKPTLSYDPVLLMRKDHPLASQTSITPEDIAAAHQLIHINRTLITLPLFESMAELYGWGGNITFERGNWEMLIHFVRAGLGMALVSTLCTKPDDPLLVAKSLTGHFLTMTYGITVKKGRYLSDAARHFITLFDPNFMTEYEKSKR
jgi:DNA-binding transcriptional LysR family regulator